MDHWSHTVADTAEPGEIQRKEVFGWTWGPLLQSSVIPGENHTVIIPDWAGQQFSESVDFKQQQANITVRNAMLRCGHLSDELADHTNYVHWGFHTWSPY